MNIRNLLILFALSTIAACTPKVTQTTTETTTTTTTPTPEPEDESLSKCKNWNNSANQSDIMTAHVLYKDGFKDIRAEQRRTPVSQKRVDSLYQIAFDYWKMAYAQAPAADGKRADHFEDGIRFYEYFISQATDATLKNSYVDSIMVLFDKRVECYGEEGYIMGRKAFDYYYKYPSMATDLEKYEMFKEAMDMDGADNAQYFILNPFTALLSNLLIEEKIPMADAQEYQTKIRTALSSGLSKCKTDKECEPWKIVQEYVPEVLAQLEGVKGFYDCDYYKEKYYAEFEADAKNCDAIVSVLGRLKWAGCPDTDAQVVAANDAWKKECYTPTEPTCGATLRDGDYAGAIKCYEGKAEATTDMDKRAQFYLFIAKIYYGELKRYSLSRKYARLALKAKPNLGAAYILIGKLYASSGPLCGPGRGWDSQIVTWPAIDKWNQAKRVDPSVASEANRLISTYSKFMPDVEDVFQRGLKVGTAYTVPCWIQEKTTIRTAK